MEEKSNKEKVKDREKLSEEIKELDEKDKEKLTWIMKGMELAK